MTRRTKKILRVISCAATSLVLFAMANAGAGVIKNRPIIVVPERTFDFKEVREGTVLEHTFKVHNKGNKVLTIKQVKPD